VCDGFHLSLRVIFEGHVFGRPVLHVALPLHANDAESLAATLTQLRLEEEDAHRLAVDLATEIQGGIEAGVRVGSYDPSVLRHTLTCACATDTSIMNDQ